MLLLTHATVTMVTFNQICSYVSDTNVTMGLTSQLKRRNLGIYEAQSPKIGINLRNYDAPYIVEATVLWELLS